AILRGLDLRVEPGERVVIMGRNGAGKSTLLRHARGLMEPTRGRVERGGEVALLMQNPGDYLIHERADQEVGEAGLAAAGLAGRGSANPRDLSGGERQRLALELRLAGATPAAGISAPTSLACWAAPAARSPRTRAPCCSSGSSCGELAGRDDRRAGAGPGRRVRLVRALAAAVAGARARGLACGARRGRAAG